MKHALVLPLLLAVPVSTDNIVLDKYVFVILCKTISSLQAFNMKKQLRGIRIMFIRLSDSSAFSFLLSGTVLLNLNCICCTFK